ncbi:hypothetical protein [Nocardia brasiliensis]|nr:hypothetical protein [Nocardia brasiliensis]
MSHLARFEGLVAELARTLVDHCRRLTVEINELATEIGQQVERWR